MWTCGRPSNQTGIPPPARDFWPLVPRPAVLPRAPEPWPRPTQRDGVAAGSGASLRLPFSFAAFAPAGSTSMRKSIHHSMPRMRTSATCTLWFSRCRPSARIVARRRVADCRAGPGHGEQRAGLGGRGPPAAATSTSRAAVHRLSSLRGSGAASAPSPRHACRGAARRCRLAGCDRVRAVRRGTRWCRTLRSIIRTVEPWTLLSRSADAGRFDDDRTEPPEGVGAARAGACRLQHHLRGPEVSVHLVRSWSRRAAP